MPVTRAAINDRVTAADRKSQAATDAINAAPTDNGGPSLVAEKLRRGTITEADRTLIESVFSAVRANYALTQHYGYAVSPDGQREDLANVQIARRATDALDAISKAPKRPGAAPDLASGSTSAPSRPPEQ